MALKDLFYKVKYKPGEKCIRILCFRFKKSMPYFIIPPPIQDTKTAETNSKSKMKLTSYNIKHVGNYSYTMPDLFCQSPETTIGSFCSIGQRVVLGHGDHPTSFLSTSPFFYFEELGFMDFTSVPKHQEFWKPEPIHIGNDVWIGDGVFVKNGVTIGDGAIIGARAVVTKNVPPYAIVVGSPAKVIKYRFSQEIIDELLELKWWDLDIESIKKIPYENIDIALKHIREIKKQTI